MAIEKGLLVRYTHKKFLTLLLVVLVVGIGLWILQNTNNNNSEQDQPALSTDVSVTLRNSGLEVDFSKHSIDLSDILNGGPGKDGIPALTNPMYVSHDQANVDDDAEVMYVEHDGDERIYPYSILVWHEIVNDTVGGKPLAITFCPLCGSAIVFETEIEGEVLEFGVSGFLFESNLLMYDRNESESLWSQSLGEAVAGVRTGQKLVHHPVAVMTYRESKERFPQAQVLSENTGYSRDYTGNPYAGYEDTEQTIFPVSVQDNRFPAKEVFYIVPLGGMSAAIRLDKNDGDYRVPDSDVVISFEKGVPTARWGTAELPGYYEMWFSWATHNQNSGIVL